MATQEWRWYGFIQAHVQQVPDVAGVYMLAEPPGDRPTVFYVGRSGALRSRLMQHLNERDNTCIRGHIRTGRKLFCYRVVRGDEAARRTAEEELRAQYSPECNIDRAG
jgi:excinuclease UvrABC nuclease subunit